MGAVADADRYQAWEISIQDASADQVVLLSIIDFAEVVLRDQDGKEVDRVPGWKGASFVWTVAEQPNGGWLLIQGQLLS